MIEKPVLARVGDYRDGVIPEEKWITVLDGITRIGRNAKSEEVDFAINIRKGSVSRRHAEVLPAGRGEWAIRDLGSTNGTYVNRVKMSSPPVRLNRGDVIGIGSPNPSFQFEKTQLNPNHALLCYPTFDIGHKENAEGMATMNYLVSRISPLGFEGNILLLEDKVRKKEHLFSWFEKMKHFCTSESVILLYIVGHGVDGEALGLHREGADTVNWGFTITYTQLFYGLSFIRGHKLLVLDTCVPMSDKEKVPSGTTVIMNPLKKKEAINQPMAGFVRKLADQFAGSRFFQEGHEDYQDLLFGDLGGDVIVRYPQDGYHNIPVIDLQNEDKKLDASIFNRTTRLELNSL